MDIELNQSLKKAQRIKKKSMLIKKMYVNLQIIKYIFSFILK